MKYHNDTHVKETERALIHLYQKGEIADFFWTQKWRSVLKFL